LHRYDAMINAGTHTAEDIATIIASKRYKQEIHLCKDLIACKAWKHDLSCS